VGDGTAVGAQDKSKIEIIRIAIMPALVKTEILFLFIVILAYLLNS
jgi:hypothetical protein